MELVPASRHNDKKAAFGMSQTSLACLESLTMPLVQEVVILADFQCAECRKRVAEIVSRMSEMESVEVNVLRKKVTLTCKKPSKVGVPAAIQSSAGGKVAMISKLFRTGCS